MGNIFVDDLYFRDCYMIKSFTFEDDRGYVLKNYARSELEKKISFNTEEVTFLKNKKGVLRGLHFQNENQQIKIFSCLLGNVWSVLVDLRSKSPTFCQWKCVDVNEGDAVVIPGGVALGTLALTDTYTMCMYGNNFSMENSKGIRWNDEKFNIDWPLNELDDVIISDKDINNPCFEEYFRGLSNK